MLAIIKRIVEGANKLDENGYPNEADFLTKMAQEIITEDLGNESDGNPDIFEIGEHGYLTNLHGEFLLEATELIHNISDNLGLEIVNFKHNVYFTKHALHKTLTICEMLKEKIEDDLHPRESGAVAVFKRLGDGEIFKFSTRNKKGFSINLDHRNKILNDLNLLIDLIKEK